MNNPYKNVYALTGILGSGKSTAAKVFRSLGAEIIDADKLAKKVTSPENPDYDSLLNDLIPLDLDAQKEFRRPILTQGAEHPEIDKVLLGKLVFSKPDSLAYLNKVIHPRVKKLFREELINIESDKKIVYDIPLLFEGKLQHFFKKVIVVYSPVRVAIRRGVQRTGLSVKEIIKRLKRQISIEKKVKLADYIIYNCKDKQTLAVEVKKIWKEL